MIMMFEDVLEESADDGYHNQVCDIHFIDKDTPESEAAFEWLEKHGINPGWVADNSLVTRNDIRHSITYAKIVFGFDVNDKDVTILGSVITVEQGEAGPFPYPEEMKTATCHLPELLERGAKLEHRRRDAEEATQEGCSTDPG